MAQWCHRSSSSNVARVQNPRVGAICGLSLLLVLSFAPRGFSPGSPVFPSTLKPTFLNSNSTRNQEDEEPLCGGATSKSLLLLFYYCILNIVYYRIFVSLMKISQMEMSFAEIWFQN